MSQAFNPEEKLLHIGVHGRKPDDWELLGIDRAERDPDRIQNAFHQRLAQLKPYEIGMYAEEAQQLIEAVSNAYHRLTSGQPHGLGSPPTSVPPSSIPSPAEATVVERQSVAEKPQIVWPPPHSRGSGPRLPTVSPLDHLATETPVTRRPLVESWLMRGGERAARGGATAFALVGTLVVLADDILQRVAGEKRKDLLVVLRLLSVLGVVGIMATMVITVHTLRKAARDLPSAPPPPVTITNSIGMRLVLIPAGEFSMGSGDSDRSASSDDKPRHQVRITKPFYLGVYEVTQAQYEQIMGENPSRFKGSMRPVEKVSWEDAVAFCGKLSAKERQEYRLPTEAEWEYTCRAGSTAKWCFGDTESTLGEYAWSSTNSGTTTHPVGCKNPNAWGLCDMHGNVCEWCTDWYNDGYYACARNDDPVGPDQGSARVFRGGSWSVDARGCQAAYRGWAAPSRRYDDLGFRLVRMVSSPAPSR